jgi:hypothetical protein
MGCCGRGGVRPRLTQQIKNLGIDLANVVAYAKSTGKVKAPEDTIKRRLDVCRSCPHLQNIRCTVCGCFISLKAGLEATSCPLKKW